jgi:hypothetical protein
MSATAKTYRYGKAPKRIVLRGDPASPESAEHVVEFPGGAVCVTRTADGDYWAHILIHRGQVVPDCEGRESAVGEVVGSRIGRVHPHGVARLEREAEVEQIAVRIRVAKGGGR